MDLTPIAGIEVAVDPGTGHLNFGPEVLHPDPDVRHLEDMRDVLFEPDSTGPAELYYMYRNVHRREDRQRIAAAGLRYDLTVLVPGTIGRELVKTAGHYHPEKAGTGLEYPEVYGVLYGKAHYLLQAPAQGRILVYEAGPGDKVVIPPGFGHVTINPGPGPLVMANWVGDGWSSLYKPFREMGGAAYFEVLSDGEPEWVPNPNYDPPYSFRWEEIEGLGGDLPLYSLLEREPDRLRFLTHPEETFSVPR